VTCMAYIWLGLGLSVFFYRSRIYLIRADRFVHGNDQHYRLKKKTKRNMGLVLDRVRSGWASRHFRRHCLRLETTFAQSLISNVDVSSCVLAGSLRRVHVQSRGHGLEPTPTRCRHYRWTSAALVGGPRAGQAPRPRRRRERCSSDLGG